MIAENTKGPVATASTDNYAAMLVVHDLRNMVKSVRELKDRGLIPQGWESVSESIKSLCDLFARKLEETAEP